MTDDKEPEWGAYNSETFCVRPSTGNPRNLTIEYHALGYGNRTLGQIQREHVGELVAALDQAAAPVLQPLMASAGWRAVAADYLIQGDVDKALEIIASEDPDAIARRIGEGEAAVVGVLAQTRDDRLTRIARLRATLDGPCRSCQRAPRMPNGPLCSRCFDRWRG